MHGFYILENFCFDGLCSLLLANGVGGSSSRGRRKKQGDDVVHSLKVSLEDLYNGTSKKLSLSRNVLCPKCKGYILIHLVYLPKLATC